MSKQNIDVKIVRHTTYKTSRSFYQDPLTSEDDVVASYDDVYDFSKENHRKDILRKIAKGFLNSVDYNNTKYTTIELLNILMDEMKEVVEELLDELPFN